MSLSRIQPAPPLERGCPQAPASQRVAAATVSRGCQHPWCVLDRNTGKTMGQRCSKLTTSDTGLSAERAVGLNHQMGPIHLPTRWGQSQEEPAFSWTRLQKMHTPKHVHVCAHLYAHATMRAHVNTYTGMHTGSCTQHVHTHTAPVGSSTIRVRSAVENEPVWDTWVAQWLSVCLQLRL